MGKVRRTQQLAVGLVGPAVQWAHDVTAGAAFLRVQQGAAPLEHDGLAMAAHVGDELHSLGRAHQGPALALLGQGVVVAQVGNGELMPEIARPACKHALQLALEQRFVKVT